MTVRPSSGSVARHGVAAGRRGAGGEAAAVEEDALADAGQRAGAAVGAVVADLQLEQLGAVAHADVGAAGAAVLDARRPARPG